MSADAGITTHQPEQTGLLSNQGPVKFMQPDTTTSFFREQCSHAQSVHDMAAVLHNALKSSMHCGVLWMCNRRYTLSSSFGAKNLMRRVPRVPAIRISKTAIVRASVAYAPYRMPCSLEGG